MLASALISISISFCRISLIRGFCPGLLASRRTLAMRWLMQDCRSSLLISTLSAMCLSFDERVAHCSDSTYGRAVQMEMMICGQ